MINNPEHSISEDFARGILSNIGQGIIATDMGGKVVYYNNLAEQILEHDAQSAYGKVFDEVFQIFDADTMKRLPCPVDYVLKYHNQTGLEANSVIRMENNDLKYVSADCSPINNSEGIMMGVVVTFRDITKLRISELKYINTAHNLTQIFNNIPIAALIVDDKGFATGANDIFLKFIDKSMEEIQGQPFGRCTDCVEDLASEYGCGTGEQCSECKIRGAISDAIEHNLITYNIEHMMTVNHGNQDLEYWVRFSVTPIVNNHKKEIVVTLVDITASKNQEINAKRARDYSTNILNQLPFTVWMSDENFRWKYSNRMEGEITGNILVDKPLDQWFSFVHPDDKEKYRIMAQEALKNRIPFVQEARFKSKEGDYRWVLINSAPYSELDGSYAGFVGSVFDITENKEKEEDIKRYQELLISARNAAETANKAKSEFLANMSHEIRTPINGIVGMIDLTLLTELTEDQRDNLVTAHACAKSLITIVNDVLDFSKMEAGKLTLENITFDLKELIEEIIKAHSPRATEKGLDLIYTFSSLIPRYVIGDPNRLRQILNNLISNAIKFTMKGEVAVAVKSERVTETDVELVFTVTDTGIGISKEDMGRLFQSFSQIENSFTRQFGGTGLGLVISKQLLEMMNGRIEVESEYGRGSTFRFYVGFQKGNAIVTNKKVLPSITKAVKQLQLLLVEDDKINQKVISKMLLERGHSVEIAENGIEAIELFTKGSFDAILMDIQMPKMNGVEATAKIRSLELEGKHTPIIALTAYSLPGDREKFIKLGMDEYVSKPIHMDTLFQVLEQVTANTNFEMPDNIVLTEDGEVIFTFDKSYPINRPDDNLLAELRKNISLLNREVENNNVNRVEAIAKEIKTTACKIDAIDIKDTAFKLELAARRSNLDDIKKYIEQISYEYKLYDNTNEKE